MKTNEHRDVRVKNLKQLGNKMLSQVLNTFQSIPEDRNSNNFHLRFVCKPLSSKGFALCVVNPFNSGLLYETST